MIERTCEPTVFFSQSLSLLLPGGKRLGSQWRTANPPGPPRLECGSQHTSPQTRSTPPQATSPPPWRRRADQIGRSTLVGPLADLSWRTLSEGSTSGFRRCRSILSHAFRERLSCWTPFALLLPNLQCTSTPCCHSQAPTQRRQDNSPPGAGDRHPDSSRTCARVG